MHGKRGQIVGKDEVGAKPLSLLKGLHSRGKTLFFSTHDVNFAAELATHVVMLKEGRLLAAGLKEEVVNTKMLTTLYGTEMRAQTFDGHTLMY